MKGDVSCSAVFSVTKFSRELDGTNRTLVAAIGELIEQLVIPAAERVAGCELTMDDYRAHGRQSILMCGEGAALRFFWKGTEIAVGRIDRMILTAETLV